MAKKREVNKTLAARCTLTVGRTGPSAAEVKKSLVGGSSMAGKEARDLAAKVLGRIGLLRHQTIYEKYEKAFDRLTLTSEELDKLREEMAARLEKGRTAVATLGDADAGPSASGEMLPAVAPRPETTASKGSLGHLLSPRNRPPSGINHQ